MIHVQTGLERLIDKPPESVSGKRLGLLCNPASVDGNFRHARQLVNSRFPGKLSALYAPQHGFFAEKQDNMIESDDTMDPALKIPVFSLYGKTRIPTKEMLEPIDILLIDLQDSGTRVYTFIYTMSYCLEAARDAGKKVIVLDRPNPINGFTLEGNFVSPDYTSFVGRYPIPMRHGLTIGELSLLFNNQHGIGCDLEVIKMKGWTRAMYFENTGLPWVPPSPNLPTPASALVYPGQVLWEGTNISEGRGTTQPFELFGAPFINTDKVISAIDGGALPGAILRPVLFEPVSNKWKGEGCKGFQIHISCKDIFKPYLSTLKLIRAVFKTHGDRLEWKPPPYEYELEKLPFDMITGDISVRQHIEKSDDMASLEKSWAKDIEEFMYLSRKYYLY